MAGMNNMAMACHTACVAATVIGAVIAVAVVSLFFSNTKASVAVSALLFAGGIAVCAAPRIFRLCGSADMACRYITKPTLTFLGSTIIILSCVLFMVQVISIRKGSVTA
jgi:FtsH-binding integral membrane protein